MAVVLIIDDDAQIRDLWTDALSQEGFEVRSASSGVKGVEIAKSEPIDVVVTDIIMPEKDGIETLMEIKAALPQAKVLAVSGGGAMINDSYLEIAGKLGADAILQKPVNIGRFCRLVRKLAKAE